MVITDKTLNELKEFVNSEYLTDEISELLLRNIKFDDMSRKEIKDKIMDFENLKSYLIEYHIFKNNDIVKLVLKRIINIVDQLNFELANYKNTFNYYKEHYIKEIRRKEVEDIKFSRYNRNILSLEKYKYPKDKTESNNNLCIISKFSNLSLIKNKDEFYNINLEKTYYKNKIYKGNISVDDKYKINNLIEREMNNNRINYSGVCSIIGVKKDKLLERIDELLNIDCDKGHSFIEELLSINIKNIYIIKNEKSITDFESFPNFNKLINSDDNIKNSINIIQLTLDDFCSIYSAIQKNITIIRKSKVNKIEDIINKDDNSINKILLHNYIFTNFDFNQSIFMFMNISWNSIIANLKNYNISMSGGSVVKRHMINPMDHIISLFLSKIYGVKNSYKEIIYSNQSLDKSLYQSGTSTLNLNELGERSKFEDKINIIINIIMDFIFENESNIYFKEFSKNLIIKEGVKGYNPIYLEEILKIILNEIIFTSGDLKKYKLFQKENNIKLEEYYAYKLITNINGKYSNLNKDLNTNKIKNNKILSLNSTRKYSTLQSQNENLEDNNNNNNNLSINDLFLTKLNSIISEVPINAYEAQLKIENDWINILTDNFKEDHSALRFESKLLMKKAKETLILLKLKNKMSKYLGDMENYLIEDRYLFITLNVIIESYKTNSHTNIAYLVGFNIMRDFYINNIYENNKFSFNDFMKLNLDKINIEEIKNISIKGMVSNSDEYLNEIEFKNSKNKFLINLGLRFIDIFTSEPVNMFQLISPTDSKTSRLNNIIKLDITDNFDNDFLKIFTFRPKNIPMVCQPNIWDQNNYGGYLQNKIIKDDILTGSVMYNKHKFEGEGKIKLYNTINYFNKIKFGINNSLLNYLSNSGSFLLEDFDKEKYFNANISIILANIFKDIPFYLPTHADWRGRIYTHSFYLTYQGNDIATALIQFWEGLPLTIQGINSFYAYGASIYDSNLDKKEIETRINWTKLNKDKILNMDPEFIKKANSPILFSAFSLEMQKLDLDKNVKIHMPIYIDATCSGIQHISAMIADSKLGFNVNLTGFNDKPEDIYGYLIEPINKSINDYGLKNKEYKSLEEIYLDRTILKQPIMTQNYNVSIFGMKDQLYNSLKIEEILECESNKPKSKFVIIGKNKEGNKEIILTHKDLIKMAMIIKQVIFDQFPILEKVYTYYMEIANLMIILNLPLQWITPTGAIITQNYIKKIKTRMTIYSNKKSSTRIINEMSNKTNHIKQKNVFIPNVIHSLDGAHILKLINDSSINLPFPILTIHDCFGTHPNYIDILFFRLKEEFISIYSDYDFLGFFHKRIIQFIKDNNYEIIMENNIKYVKIINNYNQIEYIEIPKPLSKNDLDIKSIIKSKYMFN